MKINIKWTETHQYCEQVEVPDNLDMDEVDDWVNDNFRIGVRPNSIRCTLRSHYYEQSDVEWSKA